MYIYISATISYGFIHFFGCKVEPGRIGHKPERKMRLMSFLLRTDIKSKKDVNIVEEFVLKLPASNTHLYHVTEGEVCCV